MLCNYAKRFIGKIFNATVNSVVNFGLFISSDETPIQGLIHISSLGNEYFIYNEKKNILIGDKSRKIYKVGDKIKVKLKSATPSEKKIDFVLVKKMKKNLNKDVVVGIHAVRILLKIRPYDVYEIYMVDKKLKKFLMICKEAEKK